MGGAGLPSATVWLVSELYHPELTSTGGIITDLAEGLACSRAVRVICGQPTYAARGHRAPRRELRNAVDVRRAFGTTLDKDVLPLRLINAVTLGTSIVWTLLRWVRPGDCVVVVTTPPTLPLMVVPAARLRGARCVLLVHDVYPDVAVLGGALAPGSVVADAFDRIMRWVYRACDRVVTIGRDMGELIQSRVEPGGAGKVVVVPNYAEPGRVRPEPRGGNGLLRELGLTNKFVVQVGGNMGRTHGIETLRDVVRLLRDHPDVHFLVIGSGAKRGVLEDFIRSEQPPNLTLLGRVPAERHQDMMNAGDVSLILFVPGMFGVSVPSRAYAIMAAGKPIIASMDPGAEVRRLVEEEGLGWATPAGDPEAIARAILEAYESSQRVAEMGERARSLVLREFTREEAVRRFGAVVDEVVGRA